MCCRPWSCQAVIGKQPKPPLTGYLLEAASSTNEGGFGNLALYQWLECQIMTEGIMSTRVKPLFSDHHGRGLSNGSTGSDAEDREFMRRLHIILFVYLSSIAVHRPLHFLTEGIL